MSSSKTFLSVPNKSSHPLSSHCPFPATPSPRQPLVYFLSLPIYLFWIVHVSRSIQSVTFHVWLLWLSVMFSRFSRVVACIRTAFPFNSWAILHCMYITQFALSIHSLMDVWVFPHLAIVNNVTMDICVQEFAWVAVFNFWAVSQEWHRWVIWQFCAELVAGPRNCFPQCCIILHSQQQLQGF